MCGVGAGGRRMWPHVKYGTSRGAYKEAMESGGSGLDLGSLRKQHADLSLKDKKSPL